MKRPLNDPVGPSFLLPVAVATLMIASGAYAQLCERPLFERSFLDASPRASAIEVLDVDGDGLADLAVGDGIDGTLTVYRNLGAASFVEESVLSIGQTPEDVTSGDIDGDGDLDLVVTDRVAGSVTILRNRRGRLVVADVLATGTAPANSALGDLDGDGDLDLATANQSTDDVWLFTNDGRGGFQLDQIVDLKPFLFETDIFGLVHLEVSQVALADADGDGRNDVLVRSHGVCDGLCPGVVPGLVYFPNLGGGLLGDLVSVVLDNFGSGFAVSDLDGDAVADIALAVGVRDRVTVLLGTGGGAFSLDATYDLGFGATPVKIAVADLNGDGVVDLATANSSRHDVTALVNDGAGGFAVGQQITLLGFTRDIDAGDLDGDGLADLVSAETRGEVSVLVNLCDEPRDSDPPPVPTGLIANGDSPQLMVSLSWDASPATDILHFELFRSQAGAPFELRATPGDNAFVDTGVIEGEILSYLIHAVDRSGNRSPASETVSVTPQRPTTTHVESIELGTLAGKGKRVRVQATVLVRDEAGNPVSGARVFGTFSGDIAESDDAFTNPEGLPS